MDALNPKVILVANTDWYLYNFRLSLVRSLQQNGYEVTLVSPSGRYVENLSRLGLRHIEWDVSRQSLSPFHEALALRRLLQIYRQERPDLVHHFTIKPVIYGSLAARMAEVPAVVNSITGLGYIFTSNRGDARILKRVALWLYRLAFRHPNCFATFENEQDQVYFLEQRIITAERTEIIQGVGVDPHRFIPSPEPDGDPLIVLPARILWDKGIGEMVEAARILHKHFNVRVALVGVPDPGNPSSVPLEQIQSWVEEGVIEWWGWQEDMREVFARCHIVVLPSYSEGIPKALLEAAACSKPIVAADIPGCRAIIQDGISGLLVPVKDPRALANAIERLAKDADLRYRMGSAGRQLVLDGFTEEEINAGILKVYARLFSTFLPSDDMDTTQLHFPGHN
jgi:glycosyltransferase involved in cell wall biosynthesis